MKNKLKAILLLLVNFAFIVTIFTILSHYGIVNFHNPFASKADDSHLTQDPLLLEKESLRKNWEVLSAKESYLSQKTNALSKKEILLNEKLKEAQKQIEIAQNTQQAQKEKGASEASQEKSTRNLAQKVVGIAPKDGAAILNDMESIVAVETVKMIDKIAEENGKASTSAYLISLMDPKKRKELVRLLSEYPNNIQSLNTNDEDTATDQPTP